MKLFVTLVNTLLLLLVLGFALGQSADSSASAPSSTRASPPEDSTEVRAQDFKKGAQLDMAFLDLVKDSRIAACAVVFDPKTPPVLPDNVIIPNHCSLEKALKILTDAFPGSHAEITASGVCFETDHGKLKDFLDNPVDGINFKGTEQQFVLQAPMQASHFLYMSIANYDTLTFEIHTKKCSMRELLLQIAKSAERQLRVTETLARVKDFPDAEETQVKYHSMYFLPSNR